MRHILQCMVFVCIAAEPIRAQEPEPAVSQIHNPEVATIVAGFQANRQQCPFIRAKMTRTVAHAATMDDALARRWLPERKVGSEFDAVTGEWLHRKPPLTVQCELVVAGDTTRFEVTAPADLARVEIRNKSFEIVRSELFNTDPRLLNAKRVLVAPVGKRTQSPWSPFGPGERMCAGVERDTVELQGEREIDGRTLVVLNTASSRNGPPQDTYFFIDCARGFLPVRIEEKYPLEQEPRVITVCDELFQSSDGSWVPRRRTRIVRIQRESDPSPGLYVTDEEITEWNVQHPGPADFRVAVTPEDPFLDFQSATMRGRFRALTNEIDLAWFQEDGSVNAPMGALEPALPVQFPKNQITPRPELWHLAVVLAISVTIGFGCLRLFDWMRRRRKNS